MKLGIVLLGLAWLCFISGNVVWIGHALYELFKTDQGFFTVVLSNGFYWIIQMVVGVVLWISGYASMSK